MIVVSGWLGGGGEEGRGEREREREGGGDSQSVTKRQTLRQSVTTTEKNR